MPLPSVPDKLEPKWEEIYQRIREKNPSWSKSRASATTWATVNKMKVYNKKNKKVNTKKINKKYPIDESEVMTYGKSLLYTKLYEVSAQLAGEVAGLTIKRATKTGNIKRLNKALEQVKNIDKKFQKQSITSRILNRMVGKPSDQKTFKDATSYWSKSLLRRISDGRPRYV